VAAGPLLHEPDRRAEAKAHGDGDRQHERRQQRERDRCHHQVEDTLHRAGLVAPRITSPTLGAKSEERVSNGRPIQQRLEAEAVVG
jgi:hypothetical protein